MSESGSLELDMLSKGLTRPPMILGVSITFFTLNMTVTMIVYVLTQRMTLLFIVLPAIHALGYIICFKEPLFLELFLIKGQKCSMCRNKRYYGGNSYNVL
ncbi:type IV secretion system protein VirB3 [Candidatus Xenohaliotis californiensis]|uniref:Type IV secretion system protein VirB3 n=1 Tax=Candidatus Xenohaliotis californiensis TaxID=84677 RepID=A0ABP0EVQ4_9RICK|nr:type IV secretion system protein VirB3 [Candidatus Xenohaliotis californiensis]